MGVKFIEDSEFDLFQTDKEDLLGTKPYAETLFEVIKNSNGKQNIGLFGGWGSGKSTIIKSLEGLILNYNESNNTNKIAFFKYDSWKYSNDDLRRSFIASLNNKFKVIDNTSIDRQLYQETTFQDTSEIKTQINWKQVVLSSFIVLIILIVLGFLIQPKIENDVKSLLVVISIITSLVIFLSKDFFRILPINIKESKLIEPERFEKTFKVILNSLLGNDESAKKKLVKAITCQKSYKKLVIVIDNLDRCDNESLKETLSTVKNFLEHEGVVFIIPVDENGITSFLNTDSENVDEYLRKIFHQIIRLKKFTPDELYDFTISLNEKYELNLSKTSIRLICQEFTNNPRKIIQFLNNLQTESALLRRQVEEGYVEVEFNSKSEAFLVKLLIIKQEWPELYKRLLDDINLLNKINEGLRSNVSKNGSEYNIKIGKEVLLLTRDQKRFFRRNREVHMANLEPFILNIDRNKNVPDELRLLIENGEKEEIFEILSIDPNSDIPDKKAEIILEQIEKVYDYYSNKFEDYESIAIPISNLLFELMNYESIKNEIVHKLEHYTFITRVFESDIFLSIIPDLTNFKEYCRSSLWFYSEKRYEKPYHRLVEFIINSIRTDLKNIDPMILDFIEALQNSKSLIAPVKREFGLRILRDPNTLNNYDNTFKNVEVAKQLISTELIEEILKKANKDEVVDTKILSIIIGVTDEYIKQNYLTDSKIISEYVNYYMKFLDNENTIASSAPNQIFIIKGTITKLNLLLPKVNKDKVSVNEVLIENIFTRLKRDYTESLDFNKKSLYVSFSRFCFNYMKLKADFASDTNINKYLVTFIKKEDTLISLGINRILQDLIIYYTPYSWSFFEDLEEKLKLTSKAEFLSTLIMMLEKSKTEKGLSKEQKQKVADSLLWLFNRRYSSSKTLDEIKGHFEKVFRYGKEFYESALEKLEETSLRTFVYNIYKIGNENYIYNSFGSYLVLETNFQSFSKFVRFVGKNHTDKEQEKMLTFYTANSEDPFRWIFLCKKDIKKSVFNKMIMLYLADYSNFRNNTEYLNRLLEVKKSELNKSTILEINKFLNTLKSPNKGQRTKITKVRSNYS